MSSLRILMYHKISESETDFLTVNSQQLKQQLLWLKEHYHIIKLSDLQKHIEFKTALPQNALLITFDDGYKNNYELAYPIFKELNVPFSIFLVSDFINQSLLYDNQIQDFLNTNQLLAMSDIVEFGLHGLNHANINELSEDELKHEVKTSLEKTNSFTNNLVPIWAYTYGAYPKKDKIKMQNLINIFKDNKIVAAMRIGNRINSLPIKAPYEIQRIDIRGEFSFNTFRRKVKYGKFGF